MKQEERKHWSTVAGVVMRHLPLDIDSRQAVLDALVAIMPPQVPAAAEVRAAWRRINAHICAQREFQLEEGVGVRGAGRLSDRTIQRGSARLGDQKIRQ